MSGFVPIRKSQIYHYLKTPLYIENSAGKFVLYKAENTEIDFRRFHESTMGFQARPRYYEISVDCNSAERLWPSIR